MQWESVRIFIWIKTCILSNGNSDNLKKRKEYYLGFPVATGKMEK